MTIESQNQEFEVIASGFQFVEAPRCADDGSVYFSDLRGGGLHRVAPDRSVQTVLPDRMWIGGAVLNVDGSLTVSGRGGLILLDPQTGKSRLLLDRLNGAAIDSINDMEADDDGGVYAGTIDFSARLERGEKGHPGTLFRLDPNGSINIIREGVDVSNGIDFSPARDRFYYSDFGVGIWVYDYQRGGLPSNPSLFAKLDDGDGLVVDAEGYVWVALCNHGELLRYAPEGKLDRRIALPFPHVISLCFGGEDLHDLFVATGGNDESGRPVGGLVKLRCDVPGQPPTKGRFSFR